jgi:hypothetical protein
MNNNSLNVNNGRGMDYLGPAVASSTITSLNVANNYLFHNGGIEAVASLLDKGALLKLDVRNNYISKAEKAPLQGACGVKGISLRL